MSSRRRKVGLAGFPRLRRDAQGQPLRVGMWVKVLELSEPTFSSVEPLQRARLEALQGRVVRIARFDLMGLAEIERLYRDTPRDLLGRAHPARDWTHRGRIVSQTWNLDPLDIRAVPSIQVAC
jgi:hypothetical protein